jgi:hypothetical protein
MDTTGTQELVQPQFASRRKKEIADMPSVKRNVNATARAKTKITLLS